MATDITCLESFVAAITKAKGERIAVRLARGGEERTVEIDASRLAPSAPLGLVPFVPTDVGDVQRGGPAWEAGLRRGDRIVSIEGNPVSQWSDVANLVHKMAVD